MKFLTLLLLVGCNRPVQNTCEKYVAGPVCEVAVNPDGTYSKRANDDCIVITHSHFQVHTLRWKIDTDTKIACYELPNAQ